MTNPIGAQRLNDPRGWLLFDSLPVELATAEDSTLAADHWRAVSIDKYTPTSFTRPATGAELTLLAALGYPTPAGLTTLVDWLSNGLRNRRWPALENGTTP